MNVKPNSSENGLSLYKLANSLSALYSITTDFAKVQGKTNSWFAGGIAFNTIGLIILVFIK